VRDIWSKINPTINQVVKMFYQCQANPELEMHFLDNTTKTSWYVQNISNSSGVLRFHLFERYTKFGTSELVAYDVESMADLYGFTILCTSAR
jgi:hypothetical protein